MFFRVFVCFIVGVEFEEIGIEIRVGLRVLRVLRAWFRVFGVEVLVRDEGGFFLGVR